MFANSKWYARQLSWSEGTWCVALWKIWTEKSPLPGTKQGMVSQNLRKGKTTCNAGNDSTDQNIKKIGPDWRWNRHVTMSWKTRNQRTHGMSKGQGEGYRIWYKRDNQPYSMRGEMNAKITLHWPWRATITLLRRSGMLVPAERTVIPEFVRFGQEEYVF